jgi:hypothetical protein
MKLLGQFSLILSILSALQYGSFQAALADQGDVPMKRTVIESKEKSRELYLFTLPGQNMDDTICGVKECRVVGQPGTVMSVRHQRAGHHMELVAGSVEVQTVSQPVLLDLNVLTVHIPGHSKAIVDYCPGQYLHLSLPESEIHGRILLSRTDGLRLTVFCGYQKELRFKFLENGSKLQQTTEIALNASPGKNIKLYGSVQKNQADKVTLDPSRIWVCRDTKFALYANGHIQLLQGRAFVHSSCDLMLSSRKCLVALAKNDAVSLSCEDDTVRTQFMNVSSKTCFLSQGKRLPVKAGLDILTSDSYPSQSQALGTDGIGRRCFKAFQLGNRYLVMSDFQPSSLLSKHDHIASIRRPINRLDEKLKHDLIKFSSAYEIVTGRHGSFLTARGS